MSSCYCACICCGARWVEPMERRSTGCANCGSSVVSLEENLDPESERILRQYGQRDGEPEPVIEFNSWSYEIRRGADGKRFPEDAFEAIALLSQEES